MHHVVTSHKINACFVCASRALFLHQLHVLSWLHDQLLNAKDTDMEQALLLMLRPTKVLVKCCRAWNIPFPETVKAAGGLCFMTDRPFDGPPNTTGLIMT